MFGLIKTWKALEAKGIMGINRRNADYVLKYNKRNLYPIVDDKIITKERAIEAGIDVPEMYGIIETERDIEKLKDIVKDHTDFVVKPAQGAGGDGILVIADRFEGRYRTVSGKILTHDEIEHQISNILTGLYSLGGHRDRALIEYRVTPDPIFKSISYEGVPDIRIIVLMGYPVMAMLRLPTRQSGGKANLHQGAIGVGVDLATGITLRGTWLNNKITKHPDTTNAVDGVQLPNWDGFMKLAAGCYELCGLGYIGVDMVLDEDKGPLILELNALGPQHSDRQRLWPDPPRACRGEPRRGAQEKRGAGNPRRARAIRSRAFWPHPGSRLSHSPVYWPGHPPNEAHHAPLHASRPSLSPRSSLLVRAHSPCARRGAARLRPPCGGTWPIRPAQRLANTGVRPERIGNRGRIFFKTTRGAPITG